MRLAGVSYEVIAKQLGYSSRSAVCQDIKRALAKSMKEEQESAEELLKLEIDRLDRLMASVWPAALDGDVKAVEAAERIIKRRCGLLGLDLINRNGSGDGDLVSLLGTLFSELQSRHPAALAQGTPAVEVDAIEVGEART
ncbi:hypothetical protein GCM10010466_39880 [Planomonospora alba]|uniref:Uncharacterized protein n=1 Tax=Planomonospora alba TaxID=161354 RepID=A0ABP6NDR8_9ACTN